jgi:hypothetical protein
MKDQPRAPSLEQLRSQICWWWVICERCLHWVPVALVPLIIRRGANASSDRLRRSARCGNCRWKGATLQHPSWGGRETEWAVLPAPDRCEQYADPSRSTASSGFNRAPLRPRLPPWPRSLHSRKFICAAAARRYATIDAACRTLRCLENISNRRIGLSRFSLVSLSRLPAAVFGCRRRVR